MSIKVHLEKYELQLAAQVGANRQIEALAQHRADRFGFDGSNSWTLHIEGAAGECAVAKALGLYYSGSVNTFSVGGDVGSIQVRTRSQPEYELIVRDGDRDEDYFVLASGRAPDFWVVGWITGAAAKNPEWLHQYGNRPAAYFVPHAALKPIDMLKRYVHDVLVAA